MNHSLYQCARLLLQQHFLKSSYDLVFLCTALMFGYGTALPSRHFNLNPNINAVGD
jgi:hypothetical protein